MPQMWGKPFHFLCAKEETTPAKCANCDGPQLANSIKWPKKPIKKIPENILLWRTQQTAAKPFKSIERKRKTQTEKRK